MRTQDLGYFGPDSVSWQVHREVTVLFGGARALLMQAAHPLVIAGARKTGFYERNPWKRLQRTLQLTYALTFGSVGEARAAADRINEVHRGVHGIDEATGKAYDALDPDLLLWVHACLVDSALLFERHTVGTLDDAGRQRFHVEQMLAAEMLLLPRDRIPPTVAELREYIEGVVASGDLLVTDAARAVAEMFRRPPPEAEWRPVLKLGVSRWAFGTLPPRLREEYGETWGPLKELALRGSLPALRLVRPVLPPRFRFVLPYQRWRRGSARTIPRRHDKGVMGTVDGVLLDIDGVLAVSWEPIKGAAETIEWLRGQGLPFRLVTNTSSLSRRDMAATLVAAGLKVEPEEIITAVAATASYLRSHHSGASVFLLSDEGSMEDLEGIELVDEDAGVVVIGGASELFSYENINKAFKMVMGGAPLIAMHRSLYWKTSEGLELDGGAFTRGLEEATGVEAAVCGKPARAFFEAAVDAVGIPADRLAMIGDDIATDVLAAQELGLTGVLVRSGKFRPEDLDRGTPDHVIDSIADLPDLLRPA